MLEFNVSALESVLELNTGEINDYIRIYNNPLEPTDVIYLILPTSHRQQEYCFNPKILLDGHAANLVILTEDDLVIKTANFSNFKTVAISDNKYHRDGSNFIVIDEDNHHGASVLVEDSKAINIYFYCKSLAFLGSRVSEQMYVSLHGSNQAFKIGFTENTNRSLINTLRIDENSSIDLLHIAHATIKHQSVWQPVKNLYIDHLTVGSGNVSFTADMIDNISNFKSLGDEIKVKSRKANIGSLIAPVGKVYIDVNTFLDFRSDEQGHFQGLDLYIDATSNANKIICLPWAITKFSKIYIKGAKEILASGELIAEEVKIINCLKLSTFKTSVGHFLYDYENHSADVAFGSSSPANATKQLTTIGSMWLIGSIRASFYGGAKVYDIDTQGKCHLSIYDDFEATIIKLNLNIDSRQSINTDIDGFFGLYVANRGNRSVRIEKFLGKTTTFNITGAVSLGDVISQPVGVHNLITIDAKYLNQIGIRSFFAGVDHDIVINTQTGNISLIQSNSRAITGGNIFANITASLQHFLQIRAGSGLRFDGNIDIIEGDIGLFTMFGRLSVRGSLKSPNQIQLIAIEGDLDISAAFETKSLVAYSNTDAYLKDVIINAEKFLATVVGGYFQTGGQVNVSGVVILSQNNTIMIRAAIICADSISTTSARNTTFENSSISGGVLSNKSGNNVNIIDSVFKLQEITNIADYSITIKNSRIIGSSYNSAGANIDILCSDLIGYIVHNYAKGNIATSASRILAQIILNVADKDISIDNSHLGSLLTVFRSGGGTRIEDSNIIAEEGMYFKAVQNYVLLKSKVDLKAYPTSLFAFLSEVNQDGTGFARCGLQIGEIEALGIFDKRGYQNNLNNLTHYLVNSKQVPLEVLDCIARAEGKNIFIDAATGLIIGSYISAKDHNVIIKTQGSVEFLPVGIYNSVMYSGGFTASGVARFMSKVEAGLVQIDAGKNAAIFGAIFRAANLSIKAEYINKVGFEYAINANKSYQELQSWLAHPYLYDMIINSSVVSTKFEVIQSIKLDLLKGKIDVYYPYGSKEVHLRQREGDVHFDHSAHFGYAVMSVHADQGKIMFGVKREETIIERHGGRFLGIFFPPKIYKREYIDHVDISGQNMSFTAGDIEVHGNIEGNTVVMKADRTIKIAADNVHGNIKQSIVKAENLFLTAENIEQIGSIIRVKDYLKIVSHNYIKVIPIELVSSYYGHKSSSSWVVSKISNESGKAIRQVISEIHAGKLIIDAGRVGEFVGALIEAEQLDMHVKDLKILSAREIFERQIEHKSSKKVFGFKYGSRSSTDYYRDEYVIPTIIHAGKQRIIVDNDATIETAQAFADQNILLKVGGNLTIKEGYNIHIHDYHAKKYSVISSVKGGLKFGHSKKFGIFTQEHEVKPTIICAGGAFYGIVGGKMKMLGSKIIGNDVHVVAGKGIELEASKYTDKSYIFADESGVKVGFYGKGKGEGGVQMASINTHQEEKIEASKVVPSQILARNNLSIVVEDGDFKMLSSDLSAKIISVKANNWIIQELKEDIVRETVERTVEFGIKIAGKQNITSAIDKGRYLLHKEGNHYLDHSDRVLKAYDLYKSLASLPRDAVKVGLYAYGSASENLQNETHHIAVDSNINAESIIVRLKEDAIWRGAKVNTNDFDIEARNFIFETSSDEHEYEMTVNNFEVEVELDNNMMPKGASADVSTKTDTTESKIHHSNYIKAKGNLKIKLSGTGKFKGVSLEGMNVDIAANDLILESVQDEVARRVSGMNMHVGLDNKGLNVGAGGQGGEIKSLITNQVARIIGTNAVNVVVKETLELTGALIANAEIGKDGHLTDRGNMSINAARMITKTLHDYDKGMILGVGVHMQMSHKEAGTEMSFDKMQLSVDYRNCAADVRSSLGSGNINVGSMQGDALARDINAQKQVIRDEKGKLDSVIHGSMIKDVTRAMGLESIEAKEERLGQEKQECDSLLENIEKNLSKELADSIREGKTRIIPSFLMEYFSGITATSLQAGKDFGEKLSVVGKVTGNALKNAYEIVFLNKKSQDRAEAELRAWENKPVSDPEKLEQELEQRLHLLLESENDVAPASGSDDDGASAILNKIEVSKIKAFLEALEDQIGGKDKLYIKRVYSLYKGFLEAEMKAAAKENRPVAPLKELLSQYHAETLYNPGKTSPAFLSKVEGAITTALSLVATAFSKADKLVEFTDDVKQLSFEAKELQNKAQQDPTLLKKVAVHLGVMLEKYAEFEESWPKVAALMLPAISIATKTAVGGAVGGGAGAGAGLMSGIGAEVSSAITGLIIGDSVGQITENASNYLSGLLQKADDTLTKDEARNIVAALLLTATTYKYFKSEIVDIKNFKHSINPKVSDFNQTKTFDLEKPQIDMFEGGESKQSWKDVIKKKKKEYPDTVEKINNRFPINADNAGKKYPLDKLPPELQVKYPNSIDFDHKGCARFEPYTYKDEHGKLYKVELDKFTHRGTDSAKANEIMGITDVPFGYTWHHVEDGKTMIAIPRDLHEAIRHTGGMSYSKGLKSKKNDK